MLTVGQRLWYVPSGRGGGNAKEVVVTKIGRKWATVGEGWHAFRIDLESLIADGGQYSSPGTCYLSKEVYEQKMRLQAKWREFTRTIERQYFHPPGIGEDHIDKALALLGLQVSNAPSDDVPVSES